MAAEIRITINSQNNSGGIAEATKDVEQLGTTAKEAGGGFSALKEIGIGALREIGSIAVNALGSAAGAVKDFIGEGIDAARETAKLQAQTEAVLKSTGNAAGVTAEHIAEYASALSDAAGASLFGDDQIQQSENMLLTFTNIHGTVLDAATAISVDMAQALGGAPVDNAIQLGKALNDPIKGVTALSRVGVTFTQDQKDMIQAMVETGDTAGAQAVILAELNKEFGGSAAAAAAADGGMAQFKARMGEASEALGAALLPLLNQFAGFLNSTVAPAVENMVTLFANWIASPAVQSAIQSMTATIQGFAQSWQVAGEFTSSFLERLGGAIDLIVGTEGTFQNVGLALNNLIATFTNSNAPIQTFIATLLQISPAFNAVYTIVQTILPTLQALVLSVFGTVSAYLQQHGQQIVSTFQITWATIQQTVQTVATAIAFFIQAILQQILIFWQAHGTEIMAFIQTTWNTINEIIQIAMQLIQATIVPILQYLAAFIQSHSAEIQLIFTVMWNTIKAVITAALAIIKGILQTALALIKGDWQGAWTAIQTMANTTWNALKSIFTMNLAIIRALWESAWTQIKMFFQGIMDSVVGWVIQTFEAIKNAIVSSAGKLRSAAGGVADAIVSGIAGGISDGAGKIISAAKDAAMAALDAAKSALGIGSPSKLFAAEIGAPMAEGMAVGLAGNAGMVAGAAQYVAGAGYAGAKSYTNARTMNYSPTINNYGGDMGAMDYSLANALAGI